jgi:transcriptional regulator of arginine metabolism
VAIALDKGRWPEIVGTIAGDDTIFIATASARTQRRLHVQLQSIFGR